MKYIPESELVLNTDGSIYHLNLLPQDLADTVIMVGDQDRVAEVSAFFDRVELKKGKGEFITHTGYIGSNRISAISTGIGTNNIDILLNELDALANIDFNTRKENAEKKSLTMVRIGTSGSLQEDIAVDSILVSEYAIGLDTLMHYYAQSLTLEEEHFKRSVESHFEGLFNFSPYIAEADRDLLTLIGGTFKQGITVTTPGFYAPQGRTIRARGAIDNLVKGFQNFNYNSKRLINVEMETAGIYALAKILGHKAVSVNAILVNRLTMQVSNRPQETINQAIQTVLNKIF